MKKIISSYLTCSFICIFFFSVMGCATPKIIFEREGLKTEEFNRDKYECVKESNTSWSGGGTGSLGIAMMISAKSSANKQANEMFKMCMEARGYTAREVSDEEFKNNNTLKDIMKLSTQMLKDLCKKEEYKIIFVKSACHSSDITDEQLSDKSMISDTEKSIYLKYREEKSAIRKKTEDALQASENPKMKEFLLFDKKNADKSDLVALDLINGKISWGGFNKFRKEYEQEIKKEVSRILGNK